MALRGNLKDFSLPDVFQLVTLSRKTGVLRIKRTDGAEGSVWFREGDVFFAQSNWHREPLGERLASAGKVTPSALARALEFQSAEGPAGRRLGAVLVDEGYITEKVLEAFVQEQIQDTIFDLFRWDEGDFDFEPLEGVPDEDIGLSVSIENIVMEGSRRLEEWNRIKKKIPSMEIVFKMATAPGEGTFEISLKPIEWNLLLLVDGTRSVSDLAADTNRTDFEVARILYGLFSAGLLEVASDEEVERLRAERERLESRASELRAEAIAAKPRAPAARPPERVEPAPREHEEPTFLTRQADAAPSVEDMAVFEEMMGAVLQTRPSPPPGEESPVAEVQPEPEPAPEETLAPDSRLLDEATPVEIPVEAEAAEPEAAAEPEDSGVSASDFFTVADAVAPFPPLAESVPEAGVAETEAEEPLAADAEARSDETAVLSAQPEEAVPEEAEETEISIADLESATLGLPDEVTVAAPLEDVRIEIVPEPLEEEEEAGRQSWLGEEPSDLSDLLSSLREEAEEPADEDGDGAPSPQVVETAEEETTGVISTDAFLSDFDDMSGAAFSGGLGDELTALTGGGRARPNVVSSPPPAVEHGTIKRDRMVDKDLVMRVIEGIKSL